MVCGVPWLIMRGFASRHCADDARVFGGLYESAYIPTIGCQMIVATQYERRCISAVMHHVDRTNLLQRLSARRRYEHSNVRMGGDGCTVVEVPNSDPWP